MNDTIPTFDTLRARWAVLLAGLVLGVLAGALFHTFQADEYTASAEAIVVPAGAVGRGAPLESSVGIAQAYTRIATNPNVARGAIARSGIDVPPERIERFLRVSASPDAPLIEVFAIREDPVEAARLADGLVASLAVYSARMEDRLGFGVRAFADAGVPTTTSNPGLNFHGLLGAVIGLLLAGLVALVAPARGAVSERDAEASGNGAIPVVPVAAAPPDGLGAPLRRAGSGERSGAG